LLELAENALLIVSLAQTDNTVLNVTQSLSYKEDSVSSNVTTDTKTLTEIALSAITSLESKDALTHQSHPSAEPDTSYIIITVLTTAQADL
jgi:hypothetical protein